MKELMLITNPDHEDAEEDQWLAKRLGERFL